MNSYETIPKLEKAIRERFSSANDEACNKWANEIYNDSEISKCLEIIDAGDTTSEKDIDSLTRAIRQLRLVESALKEIGWHGGKALQDSATQYQKKVMYFGYGVGILESPSVFSTQIAAIADLLETAKESIPLGAPSVNSAFGEGPDFQRSISKRKKHAAKSVSKTCATAFQELSGNRPTVTTNINDNTASGPFLNFLTEMFCLLGLEASPETWARSAVAKVKSQLKDQKAPLAENSTKK